MSAIKEILENSFLPLFGRQKIQPVPDGFVPITNFSEDDLFVVGYPKSGNTWFQDIVAGLAFGALPQLSPQSLVQDLVPDVHANLYYKRHASQMFFKSHALPTPDYKRVVYLMRDGRDAMVSYYHHMVNLNNIQEDFLETMISGKNFFPCKWHEHIEAWLANPFQSQMIVIRYEELKNHPIRELERFCDFAGLNRPAKFLKMIAEETVFEKMLDKEIKWRRGDPRWPNGKTFRRRGAIGSYKDEMPPEVLNVFLQESGETLRRCGYL